MYYIVSTTTRLATNVPYFAQSGGAATALTAALASAYAAAGSNRVTKSCVDAPNLCIMQTEKWVSQSAYDAWVAAHSTAINAYNTARDAYYTGHNIKRIESKFTSSVVVF